MHIAKILPYIDERYGGPPNAARSLGKALSDTQVEISYWGTYCGTEHSNLTSNINKLHLYKTSWPHSWRRCPKLSQKLRGQASNINVLHIYGMWSYPQWVASRIGQQEKVPYIMTPRGVLGRQHVRSGGWAKRAKKAIYMSLTGRAILNGAACVHALTEYELRGVRDIGYDGPVTIIPNGVDPDRYKNLPAREQAERRWPILKNRKVVLFLSRLNRDKGLEVMLPAFGRLVKQTRYRDAILVMAGPDWKGFGKVIDGLIEACNLSGYVLRTGMVRGRAKDELLSRADIYSLPSYYEGFSVSLLENLAAGTPVLITAGCNFPEVAEKGAGLCVEPTVGEITEALGHMLNMTQSELRAMGLRGRNLVVQHYDWKRIASQFLTLYDSILRNRSIPLYPEPSSACQGTGFVE